MITKQEVYFLVDKYKKDNLSYPEIKIRLNTLKQELKFNHINSKVKKDLNEYFKKVFKELR